MKKRKDGRYAKQVTVGVKNGKPIKKTVYGKTIKEVEKNYREMMLLVDKGVILNHEGITVTELKNEWYRIRLEGKLKTNSIHAYKSIFKRIDESIGEMKVKDVSMYTVESLLSDLQKEGYYNLSQSVLYRLRTIFDYAVQNDIILKNPCNNLSVKYDTKEKRVLTEEEKNNINTLLHLLTLKEKVVLLTLRYTGMRRGELFALKKEDIDRKNMLISINKTIIDNNGNPYVQEITKTRSGMRKIPILLPLAKPLFQYVDSVDSDYLFLNNSGKFMAVNSMSWMLKRIRSKINLGEDLTMHCFRHNFISECYMAGVDVKKLQAWVGHTDISTTLNIYTKLNKDFINNADEINKYYGSQTEVKSKKQIHKIS